MFSPCLPLVCIVKICALGWPRVDSFSSLNIFQNQTWATDATCFNRRYLPCSACSELLPNFYYTFLLHTMKSILIISYYHTMHALSSVLRSFDTKKGLVFNTLWHRLSWTTDVCVWCDITDVGIFFTIETNRWQWLCETIETSMFSKASLFIYKVCSLNTGW